MVKLKYNMYKDSGSYWIGDIPIHWDVNKLKFVSKVQPSNVDKKTVDGEEEVVLCNYTDVYKNEYIDNNIVFMKATATVSEIERFSVDPGDVIVTKDSEDPSDIAVPACASERVEGLLCGYHLTHIKPLNVYGPYVFRLFQSKRFNAQFIVSANGVTRFGLPQYVISNALTPIPPLEEQQVIAAFLDYKTAKIDALIAKKKALLDKLAEKRTALISHAVTKGLDPNAPMRDSGIDWLGEIPAHWEVKRLRFTMKTNPSKGEIRLQPGELVSFIPMESVGEFGSLSLNFEKTIGEESSGYTYFADSDVVVAKITPCFENGKGALAQGLKKGIAFGTTELHVLRAGDDLSPEYLFNITITQPFREIGESEMFGAGGQKRIPERFIRDFRIGIPAIREQKKINEFIYEVKTKLSQEIESVQTAITRLQEYRAALITNAVTGKIDVRHFVPPKADLAGDSHA